MDKELKAKWVAALRSGQYKQGTKALRIGDNYCCLGVLCDVVGVNWESTAHLVRSAEETHYTAVGTYDDWDGGVLPPSVRDKAGLRYTDPELHYDGDETPISSLNDDAKLDFDTLAQLIEEQL